MLRFYSFCLPFQSEDNYAFVNTMGRRNMKNSRCFKPASGGKSSTFRKWHCLSKIALESKRLIHTWWTWCQITWKRIFYPIQWKSTVFNQSCRWNYGSKSLHSFWATLYCYEKYHNCSNLWRSALWIIISPITLSSLLFYLYNLCTDERIFSAENQKGTIAIHFVCTVIAPFWFSKALLVLKLWFFFFFFSFSFEASYDLFLSVFCLILPWTNFKLFIHVQVHDLHSTNVGPD